METKKHWYELDVTEADPTQTGYKCSGWHVEHPDCPGVYNKDNKLCIECVMDVYEALENGD